MSLPYFPMYPTDFEADTSHLTLAEDGAYNRLLRLMWMTAGCSLPADDAWIMRRMRVDEDTFYTVVKVVMDEFFTVQKGRLISPRLAKEYQKTDVAHKKRVAAGSKGGAAKALKTNKSGSTNAKAMLKQPEPEPELIKREAKASPKKAHRLPENWTLPKQYGDWAIEQGWPDQAVRLEAEKFRDFWVSKAGRDAAKLDWLATWRNWMRNSKTPKFSAITGGHNGQPANKSEQRVTSFVSGARGAS
ncbi:YdaU family protein [Sulfitobacter mediterraneus]|uniref:YdaU family protein n=2 Tax=Sulfitobacter mediterraneus TaxID=83219 RepID=UPI0019392EA7|nr:YdaU family protein [Sulfitobacter mediterraneus]MBM1556685.1 YdaU family protein [Sulfitobacter mediterraneus]MBM1574075.1 YdaU family protein [Sulfitobacter mediterraneus]MBM1579643.1 YdaU family protein [Sulfitobacter mediterraneus]MBM1583438.1 YdaU family protein [Sulfitobacter mediterraneus]MBM1591114.1 YdaU family protein [Sulfitobacter mediterraneus]